MNIIQVFIALTVVLISAISASPPQFIISSTLQNQNFPVGGVITFTVTTSDSTVGSYSATFSDEYGNTVTLDPADSSSDPVTFTPLTTLLYGTVSLTAVTDDSNAYSSSLPVSFNVYSSLTVVTPALESSVNYGEPINLEVTTNFYENVYYTATFSCPTGSYQITGLTTGTSYNLVPAGLYGQIVVTVTATNISPGTSAFTIAKPSNNIPPSFIPGRLAYYPSVYANMKDENVLEIINVDYSQKAPM